MWRWMMRIFIVLGVFLVVAALSGATYQWLATRKELAATPPPGHLVDIGGYTCICGAPGRARQPSSSTRVSAARVRAGGSSNLRLLDLHVFAPTTGQVWDTAIPGRHRGLHAASQTSSPNSSREAELPDQSCSKGNPSPVSTSVCSPPITRSEPQVSCSWMHRTKTTHMRCRGWRDSFPCCRRSVFFDSLACRSARELSRWLHQSGDTRRQRCRAGGYWAAADEIIHIRESVSEVKSSRRRLTIPVLVVTGARGADENWRRLNKIKRRCQNGDADHRSTIRSRRGDRPTGDRCGRDPDCRGDGSRPRCPPLR